MRKYLFLPFLLAAAVNVPSTVHGSIIFEGSEYKLTSAAMNWADAENEAISWGGHLVAITSSQEQAFLESAFLSGDDKFNILWIGLNDINVEGVFEWTTGEALTYTNWKSGEPNNFNGVEDYVSMNWGYQRGDVPKGLWNDEPLNGTSGFNVTSGPRFGIIELDAAPVPEPAAMAIWSAIASGLFLFGVRRHRPRQGTMFTA